MTQLNVIRTPVQVGVWDIEWGCNSKKKKRKNQKKIKHCCVTTMGKKGLRKACYFVFLRGQRTGTLLSPLLAELKRGRGRDISIPLLIQILHLHIEKENQSQLMTTPITEVFKK